MAGEAASADFDQVVEEHHQALAEFPRGDYRPLAGMYSQRDDVTLGNPFGPFVRGYEQVEATMQRAAALFRDGEVVGFEELARAVTPEFAFTVETERYTAKMGGAEEPTPVALRVTSIFRLEDGRWRLIHRHADPITTPRGPESITHATGTTAS